MRDSTGGWYTVTRMAAVERASTLDRRARRYERCAEFSLLVGLLAVGAAVFHALRWPWAGGLMLLAIAGWLLLGRLSDGAMRRQLAIANTRDDAKLDLLLSRRARIVARRPVRRRPAGRPIIPASRRPDREPPERRPGRSEQRETTTPGC